MIAAGLSKELKAHKADIDPSAKIIVTGSNKLLRKTLGNSLGRITNY